jgi:hypothetical protein
MIRSALISLEEFSSFKLIFEPKIALTKQIARASKELCSTAISGKRDCVFASYVMSEEEPCPKLRKVDHDPVDEFFSCPSTSSDLSDASDASNHTLNR